MVPRSCLAVAATMTNLSEIPFHFHKTKWEYGLDINSVKTLFIKYLMVTIRAVLQGTSFTLLSLEKHRRNFLTFSFRKG